jgi:hypothetical protein
MVAHAELESVKLTTKAPDELVYEASMMTQPFLVQMRGTERHASGALSLATDGSDPL